MKRVRDEEWAKKRAEGMARFVLRCLPWMERERGVEGSRVDRLRLAAIKRSRRRPRPLRVPKGAGLPGLLTARVTVAGETREHFAPEAQ